MGTMTRLKCQVLGSLASAEFRAQEDDLASNILGRNRNQSTWIISLQTLGREENPGVKQWEKQRKTQGMEMEN